MYYWKLITFATIFNLLFEYSLRGINNLFVQPLLPLVLFITYFSLFTMVEDLIVRFKLKDYQLMILSFFYGTLYLAYISGLVFIKPYFFGIDIINLIFVNVVWWGALQAVLTFYLANLFFPRNWNHTKLSLKGWLLSLGLNGLAIFIFQKSGFIPSGTPLGNITVFIILFISLGIFIVSLRNKNQQTIFKKSNFLNKLSFVTIALFLFSAIFLTKDPVLSNTSNINAFSLKIIGVYTLIIAIVLYFYKRKIKTEISV